MASTLGFKVVKPQNKFILIGQMIAGLFPKGTTDDAKTENPQLEKAANAIKNPPNQGSTFGVADKKISLYTGEAPHATAKKTLNKMQKNKK